MPSPKSLIAIFAFAAIGPACRCGGSHLSSANPQITVAPACDPSKGCTASVTLSPAAIDFGPQPIRRPVPLPLDQLPTLSIGNRGNAQLFVDGVRLTGPDAAAFTIRSSSNSAPLPSADAPSWAIQSGNEIVLAFAFTPTSESQTSYQASLELDSNDPALPKLTIPLNGTLLPDQPPAVCANVVRVTPGNGAPVQDYDTPGLWAPLEVAPDGGYDFTSTRPIVPKAAVTVSALSDAADVTRCTSDPEDGRAGVTYHWDVVRQPAGGSAAFDLPDSPIATLVPAVVGAYTVRLTATDVGGHAASVDLTFAVQVGDDLAVQLSWSLPSGGNGVDLDLHLVRPSTAAVDAGDPFAGAFGWFDEGGAQRTSGEINAYSALAQRNDVSLDFDWGLTGAYDDPTDNLDDEGFGQGVENISLRYPEDDPLCATQGCTYRVLAHWFADRRATGGTACTVGSGCADGEPCDCPAGLRCVATTAPAGSAPTGPGVCREPPQLSLAVFNGGMTPVATLDAGVTLGAPCQMVHLADVVWPSQAQIAGGAPPAPTVVPGSGLARFGVRAAGDLQCGPDAMKGGATTPNWYGAEPR